MFANQRRLLLRSGTWVSVSQWAWAFHHTGLPIRMPMPDDRREFGWIAENGTAVGLGFLVASIKRGLNGTNQMASAVHGIKEVLQQVAESNAGTVFNRDFSCLTSILLGALAPTLHCTAHTHRRLCCHSSARDVLFPAFVSLTVLHMRVCPACLPRRSCQERCQHRRYKADLVKHTPG